MNGIKSIGFRNFRKFEELKTMPLGDITLLVGGNNAGKSTIGKAVRLFINNTQNLQAKPMNNQEYASSTPIFRFDGALLNIGDFGSALHFGAKRSEMIFEATLETQSIKYVISRESDEDVYGVVDSVEIVDRAVGCRIDLNIKEHKALLVNIGESSKEAELRNSFYELEKKLKIKQDERTIRASAMQALQTEISQMSAKNSEIEVVLARLNAALSEQKEQSGQDEFQSVIQGLLVQQARLQQCRRKVHTELNVGMAAMTQIGNEVDKLEMVIRETEKQLKVFTSFGGEVLAEKPLFADNGVSSENMLIRYLKYFSNAVYPAQRQLASDEINLSDLYEEPDTEDREDMPEAAKMIDRVLDHLTSTIDNLCYEYVAAHEAAQKSFYYAEAADSVSQVVCEFMKQIILPGHKEYTFVENWMRKLGIGKTFRIDSMKGEAFRVWVEEDNGHRADLAELGKGAIQFITMLLRLATIMRKYRGRQVTIIIEEPEQNMHPNWQSLLADLFYEINKDKDYRFKFIVETHSEYLIRKTQVLVARAGYEDQRVVDESCPFKVYYLGQGEPYGCGERKYNQAGQFLTPFGDGFYDEAESMNYEVFQRSRQLKKQQQ